jgi:glycosyltransferase involved in cell wall biosynthesis
MNRAVKISLICDLRENHIRSGLSWDTKELLKHFYLQLSNIKGIEVYYLVDSNDSIHYPLDLEVQKDKTVRLEDDLRGFNAFLSPNPITPIEIKSNVHITKYGVLNGVISSCINHFSYGWIEDNVNRFLNEYDYLFTFSDIVESLYTDRIMHIRQNQLIKLNYPLIPIELNLEDENQNDTSAYSKINLASGDKFVATVFTSQNQYGYINLINGFKKLIKNGNTSNIKLLVLLHNEGDETEAAKLADTTDDSIRLLTCTTADLRRKILKQSLAYIDLLYFDDANFILQECKLLGIRNIISPSLIERKSDLAYSIPTTYNTQDYYAFFSGIVNEEKLDNNLNNPQSLQSSEIINYFFTIDNMKIMQPLVTVITITLNLINANRVDKITRCIESVKEQTYGNIEHIIIDGASTDGTLDYLKKYEDKGWIKIYSQNDDGLYDAMNKGIKYASGKYITFLNSDDFYNDKLGVEMTIMTMERVQADYAFSDTLILNPDGTTYNWIADIRNIVYARNYCHQSLFAKLDVVKKLNGFDLNYRVSSDSDMMIRLYKENYTYIKVDFPFVSYSGGGESALNSEQARIDHSTSFYRHLGINYDLTQRDCYLIWQYRFMDELSQSESIRVISKIPACFNSEDVINAYFRKIPAHKGAVRSRIWNAVSFLKVPISRKLRFNKGRNEMVYYLFHKVPFWITRERK